MNGPGYHKGIFMFQFSNNNQQDATLYNNLYFTFNALHVSGGFTAHHQELKELHTQHRAMSSISAAYRLRG
jgi:hypothetical protein